MRHGSLFSGIGGSELAAEWMGWENVFHCEINSFGQKILKHHESNSVLHEDIKKTDFTKYRGSIDIISGGFPCQPYSSAGKRKGKEDDRHLWPEMLRVIREVAPAWVVGENVLGLVNWNDGMVFEEVQTDLEAEGYEVQPFILPAASVGAPHQRYRVWFVAHAKSNGGNRAPNEAKREVRRSNRDEIKQFAECSPLRAASNTGGDGHESRESNKGRCQESEGSGYQKEWERIRDDNRRISEQRAASNSNSDKRSEGWMRQGRNDKGNVLSNGSPQTSWGFWDNFPTQSPVCNGNDGFSTESLRQRIREDSMGHLSEKEINKIISEAYIAWRTETIKAGGNAIVPQVILQIFKAIEEYETFKS